MNVFVGKYHKIGNGLSDCSLWLWDVVLQKELADIAITQLECRTFLVELNAG